MFLCLSLSVPLFLCLSFLSRCLCPSVSVSTSIGLCLFVSLPLCVYVYLSLSVYIFSVFLSLCLCLPVYLLSVYFSLCLCLSFSVSFSLPIFIYITLLIRYLLFFTTFWQIAENGTQLKMKLNLFLRNFTKIRIRGHIHNPSFSS